MLFGDNTRYSYARPQLIETICQLRFPTILSISSKEPSEFQEAIRGDFPRYVARQEQQPPKMVDGKLEATPPITNYNFVAADGRWKVNVTQDFIALSTLAYTRWEDFAQQLDKILAHFIQIYHPAFFQRIGLRYVNAFSRRALGLQDQLWDDLINSPFIGVLDQPDLDEKAVAKSALDVEINLGEDRRLKLHAGPGILSANQKQDPEPRFILDEDVSIIRQEIPLDQFTEQIGVLHDYAVRLFNAALTQELKDAMGQTPIA